MDILTIVVYFILLVALVIATKTDIERREVPDWLNYGLIFLGIGVRLLYWVVTSDYIPLVEGLIGLGIFVLLAFAMFYAGQWGGGDSKLLMGMGAILGVELGTFTGDVFPVMGIFLVNLMIIGAAYGIVWSLVLAARNTTKVIEQFKKTLHEPRMQLFRRLALIAAVIVGVGAQFIPMVIFRITFSVFAVIILLTTYTWVFVKAIERACMYKWVHPKVLTEGDWIAEDVYVGKKYICGPKDLGVEMEQIQQLIRYANSGKVKKVLLREGIPFVPSFSLAFIATVLCGTWFLKYLIPF